MPHRDSTSSRPRCWVCRRAATSTSPPAPWRTSAAWSPPAARPAPCYLLAWRGTMHAPLSHLPVLGGVLQGSTLFVRKFANDWSMNLASMLAYNLITTIFPILLLMLSIAGMVLHALFVTHL